MTTQYESDKIDQQTQRIEVLSLAHEIATSQHSSKLGLTQNDASSEVENTVLQDTLRNAKRLWKFVEAGETTTKDEV
jgi:hypothetical protein